MDTGGGAEDAPSGWFSAAIVRSRSIVFRVDDGDPHERVSCWSRNRDGSTSPQAVDNGGDLVRFLRERLPFPDDGYEITTLAFRGRHLPAVIVRDTSHWIILLNLALEDPIATKAFVAAQVEAFERARERFQGPAAPALTAEFVRRLRLAHTVREVEAIDFAAIERAVFTLSVVPKLLADIAPET